MPGGPSPTPPQPATGTATGEVRCVLWHSPDGPLPGDLLTSLSRKVPRLLACTDSYAAFAEVCRVEADRREAAAAGFAEPALPSAVLLLVNPRGLPEAGEIIEAAGVFAPSAKLWWYDPAESPQLRRVGADDPERWAMRRTTAHPSKAEPALAIATRPIAPASLRSAPPPPPPATGGPRLRLSGDGSFPVPGPSPAAEPAPLRDKLSRADEPPEPRGPLLTQEELRMLLSDDPVSSPVEKNGSHPPNPPPPKGRAGGTAGGHDDR